MTPRRYTEAELVERPALELLAELDWTVVDAYAETLGPAGTLGRDSIHDVVLTHRLRDALRDLNPAVPEGIREEALNAIAKDRSLMDPTRANQEIHELLRDGYRAQWRDDRGEPCLATVRYLDFAHSAENDWLAASQVWVAGELHRRRIDTILFVNGIPLVLAEFKEPNEPVEKAYEDNLTDYRDTIPQLFWPNGFVILSNGSEAKVGATLGVNASIEKLMRIRSEGDTRLGVFWHTQGSGKSLSMLWFTQKVLRRVSGTWTFVMVTDRTELDVQLHGEFADAGVISREARVHASSSAQLRELLAADHRYVFTLIHKFRIDNKAGESEMPILSDRRDVIVITDEAHRSQYDTLAQNMRAALPNAAFMGFTGTPLVAGEELTRREFGDYVSVYNFRDAIADGATVPLYYENRIPELTLDNPDFSDELMGLLEEAELDENAEGRLVRRFAREYALIARPERLRTIARDLVRHFVGRGFSGKAMYVGVDKAAAVRMYDEVRSAWAEHLIELQSQHDALPELERPWLASRTELMETTDMAVVVSQGQNEIKELADKGLDIKAHRARMLREDLAKAFKDSNHPLRLVFVCAMWMTGFDAPSVSTIYLDRPMRNHTLMQTIARANRVFPDKENGLIVDYIGVFRDLERALAIYGAANAEVGVDSPIQDKSELLAALAEAVDAVAEMCERFDIDLDDLRNASGFEFIALRDAAVEALLADLEVRTEFLAAAGHARKLFKAVLPDPAASIHQATVAVIRVLAERIADVSKPPSGDIDTVADAVDELLDRSVGAAEYVIPAAAEYNAGSVNIDEYLRRLIALSRDLSHAEHRAVVEDMTEAELAIFDLLTQPEPVLDAAGRDIVRTSAKRLLAHLHDKLVLDWRRKAATRSSVRTEIRDVLDADLPADPYPPELFDTKVQAVFDHIVSAYGDDGSNVYETDRESSAVAGTGVAVLAEPDLDTITAGVIERIRVDAQFASLLAEQLGVTGDAALRTVAEIVGNDEDFAVEFKSTARRDLREGKPSKLMEDAIVKTVAGFLNTDGGTLLIGVGPDRKIMGPDHDHRRVKPPNGDGFVNWLTTHLTNALGHTAVMRTRARISPHEGREICRLDVAHSTRPVWAKTSKDQRVFFVRMNNSPRHPPHDQLDGYLADRWPQVDR